MINRGIYVGYLRAAVLEGTIAWGTIQPEYDGNCHLNIEIGESISESVGFWGCFFPQIEIICRMINDDMEKEHKISRDCFYRILENYYKKSLQSQIESIILFLAVA